MGIIESTAEKWHQLTYEQADPRTRDYPLMGSPTAVILICIFYAVLIKVILARYMEQRKAYNTRLLSLGLNIYLFSTACYFFYGAISIGWFSTYSFFCEPLDRSYSDEALRVANIIYAFFLVKLTYMLETVVFMLGKKDVLVSKYHVFHHATLPLLIWMSANYYPGGQATFFGLINSIVHIIVLGYFVVVTALPGLKKYIPWWRSAFNWLHIIQFSMIIIHSAQLFFWNYCEFPMLLCYSGVVYGCALFALYLASWL